MEGYEIRGMMNDIIELFEDYGDYKANVILAKRLIALIIKESNLSWDKSELAFDCDTARTILDYIKVMEPGLYEKRLRELKAKEEE